jgi:hypothetical protein
MNPTSAARQMGARSQLDMFKPSTNRISRRPFHFTSKLPATIGRSRPKRYSRKSHAKRVLTINRSLLARPIGGELLVLAHREIWRRRKFGRNQDAACTMKRNPSMVAGEYDGFRKGQPIYGLVLPVEQCIKLSESSIRENCGDRETCRQRLG